MTQREVIERRLVAAENRTRKIGAHYRELRAQHLQQELDHNRALAHIHDLLVDGGIALAVDYIDEHLERVASWSVDRMLEDLAANPPTPYDGVGVKVFAE